MMVAVKSKETESQKIHTSHTLHTTTNTTNNTTTNTSTNTHHFVDASCGCRLVNFKPRPLLYQL
jgi:hypothetical protein